MDLSPYLYTASLIPSFEPPLENALLLCMSPHIYNMGSHAPKAHDVENSG